MVQLFGEAHVMGRHSSWHLRSRT